MQDWQQRSAALYNGDFRPMFIGGKWCEARSGEVIEARNPASGEILATVPKGGSADIDAHKFHSYSPAIASIDDAPCSAPSALWRNMAKNSRPIPLSA